MNCVLISHRKGTMCDKNLCLGRIPGKGRGVMAGTSFYTGDVIEQCAGIRLKALPKDLMRDYVFSDNDGGYIVATGLCSMYNHRDTPNAQWSVQGTPRDPNSWTVVIQATQPINPGEEIFISYGDGYWRSRPHLKKR